MIDHLNVLRGVHAFAHMFAKVSTQLSQNIQASKSVL